MQEICHLSSVLCPLNCGAYMETINLIGFFEIFKNFGLVGLIIVLWWMDQKKVYKILDKYKADMAEQRRMYESNVSLVKDYQSVAGDLKDVVIINTQAMTTLSEQIRQNEFCPMQRVNKKKVIQGRT